MNVPAPIVGITETVLPVWLAEATSNVAVAVEIGVATETGVGPVENDDRRGESARAVAFMIASSPTR